MLRGKWRDLAWISPLIFALMIFLPLAWSPPTVQEGVALRPLWFLFGAWGAGIVMAFVIARQALSSTKAQNDVDH